MPDEDKHKTKLSTFKPKALRNPKTFKNLQNAVGAGKENSEIKSEREVKKDGFGNNIFGNLKPMIPMSKVSQTEFKIYKHKSIYLQDYDQVVEEEEAKKVPINLKPVRATGASSS